ncbi:hypothetical protein [Hydrogenophaga sp.]|uniref:hypothetical protein n=1 Tax=Hydrogenophaga sp. TaxID=1904254 RepID=UPI002717FD52|nr:hypothetical protein [Hydrogenophaga sp.]MDO8903190.1 hypothetical protein [Hydrogenophaga sp.]
MNPFSSQGEQQGSHTGRAAVRLVSMAVCRPEARMPSARHAGSPPPVATTTP